MRALLVVLVACHAGVQAPPAAPPRASEPLPDPCKDRTDRGEDSYVAGRYADAFTELDAAAHCMPDERHFTLAYAAACNANALATARKYWKELPPATQDRVLHICTTAGYARDQLDAAEPERVAAPVPPPSCGADDLTAAGERSYDIGQYGVALKKFEAAAQCRPDERAFELVFMAACQTQQLSTARLYWGRLSDAAKDHDLQICLRSGFRREQLDESPAASRCEVAVLTRAGKHDYDRGEYRIALDELARAWRCQPDEAHCEPVVMAACAAHDVAAAREYWKQLSALGQSEIAPICKRSGIGREQLDR